MFGIGGFGDNGAWRDEDGVLHCRVCNSANVVPMTFGNLATGQVKQECSGLCASCLKKQESATPTNGWGIAR